MDLMPMLAGIALAAAVGVVLGALALRARRRGGWRALDGDAATLAPSLELRRRPVEPWDVLLLGAEEAARFAERWQVIEEKFSAQPAAAVNQADGLVTEMMMRRGYPMGDFERRAHDIAARRPNVVVDFRIAHAIALAAERGVASGPDLRRAMTHYRALFQEIVGRRGDARRIAS